MNERDEVHALYEQQKAWEAEQEYYASESAKAEANMKAQEEAEMAQGMSEEKLREKIVDLVHWKQYNFIQGNMLYEGILTQKSEELIANQIIEALPELAREAGKEECCYCHKKPDGAMLSLGFSIAHTDCVIQKLNELLDKLTVIGDEEVERTLQIGGVFSTVTPCDRRLIQAQLNADLKVIKDLFKVKK